MYRLAVALVSLSLVFAACSTDGDTPLGDGSTNLDGGADGALADAGPDGTSPDGGPTGDGAPPTKVTRCNNPALTPPASGTCSAKKGTGTGILIAGTILAPDVVYENGHLLIAAGKIACVGCDCSKDAAYKDATRIECAKGVVSPGLINPHDHLDWAESAPGVYKPVYEHRHDWRRGATGKPKLSNPSNARTTDGRWWGELRMLLAGATSIMGSATPAKGILRDIDSSADEGLTGRFPSTNTFPLGDLSGTTLTSSCKYRNTLPTPAKVKGYTGYLPHLGEGINAGANNEVRCLNGERADGVNVLGSNVAFVHGVALRARDVRRMSEAKSGIIWAPRSNVSLYGMTVDLHMLKHAGIKISLGTDWVRSGSISLLRELVCARELNDKYFGKPFTTEDLWRMVTANAADHSGFSKEVGRLSVGLVGDVAVFADANGKHHGAVVKGTVKDVALVLRGGTPLYGDEAVMTVLARAKCEAIDVCGVKRTVCVEAETGVKLAKLTADITAARKGKSYKPEAPYPLFACGKPAGEPSCVPTRAGKYTGIIASDDKDGDGVKDGVDTCPGVFNPPRPMNGDKQLDGDSDKLGDECDPCPLDANKTACSKLPPLPPPPAAKAFTIKQLTDTSLGKRPTKGTKVALKDVTVVAIRTSRTTSQGYHVREGKASYEALFVFTGSTRPNDAKGNALKIGDVVSLEGNTDVFNDIDQIASPAKVVVNRTGGDVTPVDIKTKDLQPLSKSGEKLGSQLVRVKNVTVKVKVTSNDTFWVADDTATCTGTSPPCTLINDFFFDGGTSDGKPASKVTQVFTSVTGVVNNFRKSWSLDIRTAADLVAK